MKTTRRTTVIAMLVALASLATPAYALAQDGTGNDLLDVANGVGDLVDGKGIGPPDVSLNGLGG
jgi:hypothetical protein